MLAITMGMVVVAPFAANAGGFPVVTIKSTLRRTRSAASSFTRSSPLPSANRYSMVMFFPSIQPSLVSSCRNASTRTALPEALLGSRKPMRKIFPGCCASAEPQSVKSIVQRVRTVIFRFMFFPALFARHSSVALFSLDHLIRSHQHVCRNCKSDQLRRFQIVDELELGWLLDREIGRLGSFEDLIHVGGSAAEQISPGHAVGHKPTGFHKFRHVVYSREPVLYHEFNNLWSMRIEYGTPQRENSISSPLAYGAECSLNILGIKYIEVLKLHIECL